jgi:hypothetical protein
MFSILHPPFVRLWPQIDLGFLRSRRRSHANTALDAEAMPDYLKRDLGLADGRAARGARPHENRAVWGLVNCAPRPL